MLPTELEIRLKNQLGSEYNAFAQALKEPPQRVVRLNKAKLFNSSPISFSESVPWYEGAWYVSSDFHASDDPLWYAGAYYVQEPSSLILNKFLSLSKESYILDLAAAPGGKTTLIADNMPKGSVLVANEVIKKRVRILDENITRWG